MLTRDFIHDSLYNPHYGYFSRHAVLLPEGQQVTADGRKSWDFSSFKNDEDFMRAVEERYNDFEKTLPHIQSREEHFRLDQQKISSAEVASQAAAAAAKQQKSGPQPSPRSPSPSSAQGLDIAKARGRAAYERSLKEDKNHDSDVQSMVARQVWHTPTELFKPHYASIVAEHCVFTSGTKDELNKPLVVYEFGAGSGALAEDFLGYLAQTHPGIYERTQYNIVEISQRLATQQRNRLSGHVQAGRVKIHHGDFLEWSQREERECFVIGLEVLDNLSHDAVRYSTSTLQAYQTLVSVDATGDMHELFVPVEDPLIARYLSTLRTLRPQTTQRPPGVPSVLPYLPHSLRRAVANHFPFFPNLSPDPHYIPTHSLKLLDVLRDQFPRRKVVLSDFSSLPDTIRGVNAPVVQTRIHGIPIDVQTYTVLQGFFDIFFPTDFNLLRDFYAHDVMGTGRTCASSSTGENPRTISHREFLASFPELAQRCQLANRRDNPMLTWYENARWLVS